jgi:hypothetical protein
MMDQSATGASDHQRLHQPKQADKNSGLVLVVVDDADHHRRVGPNDNAERLTNQNSSSARRAPITKPSSSPTSRFF